MAIADYDTLKAAVQNYTARSDTKFGNTFPTFLSLCESRIFDGAGSDRVEPLYSAPVRAAAIESLQAITLVAGAGPLPANFLDVRRLNRAGAQGEGLSFLPPQRFNFDTRFIGGTFPKYYTIEAGQIQTAPLYDGALDALCYIRPAALSVSNQTNAMLTAYGELYLMGCLFEAYAWMQEQDTAMGFLAKYNSIAGGINRTSQRTRDASTKLRVRVRSPIP